MVAQDRTRNLITTAMLPALLAPPVALADEALPTAAEAGAAIHGTFNNGEDITRPRTLFQARQRYERFPMPRAGSRKSGRRRCAPTCGPASATAGSSTGAWTSRSSIPTT